MNESRFLVDNNALVQLTSRRIRSQFFLNNCYVTQDVLYEAGDHPDRGLLEDRSVETEPAVLELTRHVMSREPVGDTALVDLYANKGAADPGLIARALFEKATQDGQFFADSWVVVTNDRAVAERAKGAGLEVLEALELAALIDSSGSQHLEE